MQMPINAVLSLWRDARFAPLRYLAVSGWNTVFGLGVYALLYWCFGKEVNYLVLAIPANILAITNAYIGYKLVVFRTRGNILREYFKCYLTYGGGALLGMVLLAFLVRYCGFNPVAANSAGTVAVAAASYFGHRHFTFRRG